MFPAFTKSLNKTPVATLLSGAILAAGATSQAFAGGEGGGREDVVVSMTNPNGTRDTLRGHRDGSRTFTRTKRGKVVFKKRIRKAKKARRAPRRGGQPSMRITNPDSSTTTVQRNPNGSRTVETFDRNGNRTSWRTAPHRRPGTWSASGTNHTSSS